MPFQEVMGKFKRGELHSGKSDKKVTNRKQAIAIMLSEKKKKLHGLSPNKRK